MASWIDENLFMYGESGNAIRMEFRRPDHPRWPGNGDILVYINTYFMKYGSPDVIRDFVLRGLTAGGIEHEDIANLHLYRWDGGDSMSWKASIVPITAREG